MRRVLAWAAFLAGVQLVAALPGMFEMLLLDPAVRMGPPLPHGAPPPPEPTVADALRQAAGSIAGYLKGLVDGSSFTYQHVLFHQFGEDVVETRNFIEEIKPLFLFSTANMALAGVLALLLGTIAGLALARSGGWFRALLEFLDTVPDFAAVFFLQLLVVFIYKETGERVAEVFTVGDDIAYALPFMALFYLPFVYIVRMTASHTLNVLTEDYILTAKAKGLDKFTIYARHVLRNVLPFIKADLFRIASIMSGNLVIVEFLFNSPGITRFLAPGLMRNLDTGLQVFLLKPSPLNQYSVLVNTLWSLALIFLVTWSVMRLFLFGLERRFARD
jgi:peptide/nickel transport system permease protein